MPLAGETTATEITATMTTITTATSTNCPHILMETRFKFDDFSATAAGTELPADRIGDSTNVLSPFASMEFDESQCLFCTHTSQDLDLNMSHMSQTHGLHVDPTNLIADTEALLSYLHLVIFKYHECLYCGTQRSSTLAVQQHMRAKGHCKYDIAGKDLGLNEFFDIPSIAGDRLQQHGTIMRTLDGSEARSRGVQRKKKASKRTERPCPDILTSSDQPPSISNTQPPAGTERDPDFFRTSSRSLAELRTRRLKQEYTLNNQLAQLRASDRKSFSHLPASEQRALLLTHHKQTENAKRSEQKYKGHLESAGNSFNCLGKIRLIRKPPHTGNIHSLKR